MYLMFNHHTQPTRRISLRLSGDMPRRFDVTAALGFLAASVLDPRRRFHQFAGQKSAEFPRPLTPELLGITGFYTLRAISDFLLLWSIKK